MRFIPIHFALCFFVGVVAASGQDRRAPVLPDFDTVAEASEHVQSTLESKGFEILLVIDHAAAAASVGLDLPPTEVIFFSAPKLDRRLIRRRQRAALDLPLKFLIFEDAAGLIRLERNGAGFLLDRHEVFTFDPLFYRLSSVLDQFGSQEDGVGLVRSEQSVEDTVAKLLDVLRDRDFRIPAVIDFDERAGRRSRLRPTELIVFGNPNVGTPLMQNDRSIALDLPQKFLVFEDRKGDVFIAYNDPRFLAEKHNLQRDVDPILETRLGNIANALQALAELGATP